MNILLKILLEMLTGENFVCILMNYNRNLIPLYKDLSENGQKYITKNDMYKLAGPKFYEPSWPLPLDTVIYNSTLLYNIHYKNISFSKIAMYCTIRHIAVQYHTMYYM